MKTFGALLAATMIPFMLLNAFGGVVAGIWLAILGEWSAILLGIAILFAGPFVVSLFLAPGMGLAGLGLVAIERGNKVFGWFLLLLASPWTSIVIVAWEIVIFKTFGALATAHNVIPMWLWSYGAATGVWSYMARAEQQTGEGGGATAAAFGAQIAYVVLAVCQIWLQLPLAESALAMMVPLLVPLAFSLLNFLVRPKEPDHDPGSDISADVAFLVRIKLESAILDILREGGFWMPSYIVGRLRERFDASSIRSALEDMYNRGLIASHGYAWCLPENIETIRVDHLKTLQNQYETGKAQRYIDGKEQFERIWRAVKNWDGFGERNLDLGAFKSVRLSKKGEQKHGVDTIEGVRLSRKPILE